MNDDAFRAACSVLQVTFTPLEYRQIVTASSKMNLFSAHRAGASYWSRLPRYLISRCPICAIPYTVLLDTHSLVNGQWYVDPGGWESFGQNNQVHRCHHFVAEEVFVSLNGFVPNDLEYYINKLDVPFVMPPFFEGEATAVIHSVPICHIEQDVFVPRYTAFIIVYYAPDPALCRNRRKDSNLAEGANDLEYYPSAMFTSGEASRYSEAYNLELWVIRQKLYWLDTNTPDLALRTGELNGFPYANIQGYRRPFTIRDSRLIFD